MRFSLFPLLIASAGLAHHVTATPLRVAVTEMTNIRFGHAVANANTDHGDSNSNNNDNIAHGMLITSSITELDDAGRPKMQRRPCGGGGLKANVVSISNTFRKALGLPVIDTHPNLVAVNTADDGVHIVPVPGSHYQHHAEGHYKVRHYRGTFMRRVHHALMALGPWEGRAVAFVLGMSQSSIGSPVISPSFLLFKDAVSVFS